MSGPEFKARTLSTVQLSGQSSVKTKKKNRRENVAGRGEDSLPTGVSYSCVINICLDEPLLRAHPSLFSSLPLPGHNSNLARETTHIIMFCF